MPDLKARLAPLVAGLRVKPPPAPATLPTSYDLTKRSTAARRLYIIPGVGGSVLPYKPIADHLAARFKVIGLHGPYWATKKRRFATSNEFIDHFSAIISDDGRSPIYLFGDSGGGTLALEMARRFRKAGKEAWVILFDSECPRLALGFGGLGWTARHIVKLAEYRTKISIAALRHDEYRRSAYSALRALRRHHPEPCDFPVSLIRPDIISPKIQGRFADDLGWRSICSDLTIRRTPGDHTTAFKKKNAASLARNILLSFEQMENTSVPRK